MMTGTARFAMEVFGWSGISFLLHRFPRITSLAAPLPYMDEIFHIPQAERFCASDYAYDPMITTFPGTYLIASLAHKFGVGCDTSSLRKLAGAAIFLLLRLMVFSSAKIHGYSPPLASLAASALTSWPVTLFTGELFYTDAFSLLAVMTVHVLAHKAGARGDQKPSKWSLALTSIAGAAAIAIRQTNIVWVAFSCFSGALHRTPLAALRSKDKLDSCKALIAVLHHMAPAFLLGAPFAMFVIANGGSVVLGDASHHKPVFHFAQLCYLCTSIGAYIALDGVVALTNWLISGQCDPIHAAWLEQLRRVVFKAGTSSRTASRTPARQINSITIGAILAFTTVCAALLHRFSYAHPYLLADNRHYTFYLWSRVLGPRPWLRVALAPAYVASALLIATRLFVSVEVTLGLSRHGRADDARYRSLRAWAWVAAWFTCAAVTVVPAHLLELRYFMVPLTMALLHVRHDSLATPAAITGVNLAVHAATMYVFLAKPFTGPDGSEARFMW